MKYGGYIATRLGLILFSLFFSLLLITEFTSCAIVSDDSTELIINVGSGDVGSKAISWPPNDIVSYTLTVSGPDISSLEASFPGTSTSIGMFVPKGSDRLIEIVAFKNPQSSSAVLSWKGSTTVNLQASSEVINLPMQIDETKLVIPDADDNNNQSRIIQIENMTGTGWTERSYADFGFTNLWEFQPADIDFDNRGRIYIANNYTSTGVPTLIRIDSLAESASYETIVSDSETNGLWSIAVDRTNNYIYYTTGSSPIYRKSLGPPLGVQESFNIQADASIGNFNTRGIAVDQEGVLYIANNMEDTLIKYDVSYTGADRVKGSYSTNLNYPWDVLINNEKVFVANSNGADDYKFVVLDKNLNLIDHFGDYPADTGNPADNEIYGPERFVAITNRKITVIDEGSDGPTAKDRLVGLNPDGSGWQSYGSTGSGVGQFYFFSYH